MCRGDPVAIIGGGNSAGQAAVFLSRHAAQVTLIVREPDLRQYMSRYLIDQIGRIPNVHVLLSTEVRELLGDRALEAVAVAHNRTGERRVLEARALFVFIGMTPSTGWLTGLVDLDEDGFVRTGPDVTAANGAAAAAAADWHPSLLETSQPSVFAVGDVRSGSAKRVATAVGDGAMAIRLAYERLRSA
jgi:thioredoxin reductase (NADPH)